MVDHTIRVSEALAVENAGKGWTPYQRFLVALLKQRLVVKVAEARIDATPVEHVVEWLKGCGASMTGRVETRARSTDLIITSVCLGDDDTDPTDGLDVLAYDGGGNRAAFKLRGKGRAWSLSQTKGAPFFSPDPDETINFIAAITSVGLGVSVSPNLKEIVRKRTRSEKNNINCTDAAYGKIGAAPLVVIAAGGMSHTGDLSGQSGIHSVAEKIESGTVKPSIATDVMTCSQTASLHPIGGATMMTMASGNEIEVFVPVPEKDESRLLAELPHVSHLLRGDIERTGCSAFGKLGSVFELAASCQYSTPRAVVASYASDRKFSAPLSGGPVPNVLFWGREKPNIFWS